MPLHDSATSQGPAAARHEVAALAKMGAQVAVVPSQMSATSQAPLAALQTVPVLRKVSAGHVVRVPLHISATSHVVPSALTCAGRQTVDALANALGGQVLLLPSQTESS